MGNAKHNARKALAVFSAAALLLSCGATGFVTNFADTSIKVSAAENVATQLKLLDENGNELGDDPIIYLDSSPAAGGITSRTIQAVASNNSGVSVDDEILCFYDSGAEDVLDLSNGGAVSGKETLTATVSTGTYKQTDKGMTWEGANKSGTTHLHFTTASGEVYRTITVVVYQPATDMRVYWGSGKTKLDLNDDNPRNACNIMVIANHQYQFTGEKVPTNSTDKFEWSVVDGGTFEGKGSPAATNKAEITANGLFTPKRNGSVTIIAKYMATETSKRDYALGDKKVDGETLHDVQNVPKYIHVTIVKENPAKNLKITSAPSGNALEVGDTFQLGYEATATYSGSGYETGATDVFTWTSSNPKVATVDSKGLVTAVGKGDTKITVFGENENVRAEIDLKVLTKATSITFDKQTMSTRIGVETPVTAIMSPATADEEIVWSSSDNTIATVRSITEGAFSNEQSAVVTGIKKGTVKITATAKSSGVQKTITCSVLDKINATEIVLTSQNGTTISNIYEGTTVRVYDQKQITINGSLVAADGTSPDDTLVWTVLDNGANNSDYVSVDSQNGSSIQLTGFARGTVRVRASSKNNPSLNKTFYLQILKKATKGTIINNATEDGKFNKNLNVGSTLSLSADLIIETNQPYDHDDLVAKWESSNEKCVTIDNTGFLKVVGNGSSTVRFITESGYTGSVKITGFTTSSVTIKNVTANPGSMASMNLTVNKDMIATKQMSATVKNEKDTTVSDVALSWSSSDERVATIDEKGLLTAHNLGDTVVTVKSGSKTDQCLVQVNYTIGNAKINIADAMYSPFVTEYKPKVELIVPGGTDILGMPLPDITLAEGEDYTLEYSNNTTVGQSGTVVITGMGDFAQSVKKTFKINARPINDKEVTFAPIGSVEMTINDKANGVKPALDITHNGYQLVEGTDYTITYSNNKKAGAATAKVTAKGNYSGTINTTFEIYCNHGTTTSSVKTKATCKATGINVVTCSICGNKEEVVTPVTDHNFVKGTVVAPTYDADGYTIYKCSVCGTTEQRDKVPALKRVSVKSCTITLSQTNFTANGSAQYPKVTVKYGGKTLSENKDYTLSYSNKNSKTAGTYTVKIVGKDGYKDTVSKSYTITAAATAIKLDKTATGLGVGETITLKATTTPANSTVTWKTSNASVVTVTNGKITGKKAGTATITATSGKVRATCAVTVKAAPTSVSLSKTAVSIGVGEKFSISSIIPANTAAVTRTYSSSNSSIVRMTRTSWIGEFVGVKAGTATVTVKLYNGKTAKCTVVVRNAPSRVSLNKTSMSMGVGETFTLSAILPANTAAAVRTYSSSNPSVVQMTRTDWVGTFKALKKGTAKVTVKLYNGKTATCTIYVNAAPSSVKLNKTAMTLKVGQTATVNAIIPSGSSAAKRTYRSSNSSVVQMTRTDWVGTFKAVKPGVAWVSVTLYNGKVGTCKVTVVK